LCAGWLAMRWNLDELVRGVLFGFILKLTLILDVKKELVVLLLLKCCVGVSFELRRFSTPLLFLSAYLPSNHFLTRGLGIVHSLTIRRTSPGAYPNWSCTQITTYSSLHSDKRKLEGFNVCGLFFVRVPAER